MNRMALDGIDGSVAARSAAMLRSASVSCDQEDPVGRLLAGLGPGRLALVALFASPRADLAAIAAEMNRRAGGGRVIGCSTAGEISGRGYVEGEIVAVALPAAQFAVRTLIVDDLDAINQQRLIGDLIRARAVLGEEAPGWESEFAFLMVDGLSVREDELTSALAPGLGRMPLFGGSAGDGTAFRRTLVSEGGRVFANAGVLAVVRTACRVRVFSLDHLRPTDQRMVVTDADPKRRLVRRINAEPAAREYARLLKKDPEQLTPFTFAAHPVVVRIGGAHHVRAIQRVTPEGHLVFFSAIDEGMVLCLAEPQDMTTHLERELSVLSRGGVPDGILACDCILRRMEAGQKQLTREISEILARHRVVGFSTYGEQKNAMHVNQTMTGVAIYPPSPSGAEPLP